MWQDTKYVPKITTLVFIFYIEFSLNIVGQSTA